MSKLMGIAVFLSCFFVGILGCEAQEVIYGTNNYIEYQVGTLPLVISVPHGGDLAPANIPDRTCNNAVYDTDANTIEMALEIKDKLYAATGCYPHIIISHLERSKLDPNRNEADGACGNSEAITAWNEFHNFISQAQNTANEQYNGKTFFVDLHGHGNPIQRIELGYLLYDDELELSDSTLNTATYIGYSSIQNLVSDNVNNYTHAQLLRGPFALGSLLANAAFPAVPSESIPFPGTTTNYYSGGYITAHHTCYDPSIITNGVQMELNYTGVRDTPANRSSFALSFTEVMVLYLNTHFAVNWNQCSPISDVSSLEEDPFSIFPNPIESGSVLHVDVSQGERYEYVLENALAQVEWSGRVSDNHEIEMPAAPEGIYLLRISNASHTREYTRRIVIQ